MLVPILRQHRGLPQASIRLSALDDLAALYDRGRHRACPAVGSRRGICIGSGAARAARLPFAVADAEATVAVVAQSDGRVAAVELSSGHVRWRSPQGRWPLASAYGWVAVGAPDSADPRTLRVRFLRPTDGKLIVASAPIALPAVIGANASWEGEGLTLGTGNTSVQLSAWIPRPKTSGDSRAGRLHIRWRTQSFVGGGGMRPPERGPVSVGDGLRRSDERCGIGRPGRSRARTGAPAPETATIVEALAWDDLLELVMVRRGLVGHAPRVLDRPGPGGLLQLRNGAAPPAAEPLRTARTGVALEIAAGGEWAPQVSLDGRHLLLSKGNAGVETFTLFDLLRPGSAAAIPIPHLEPRFRSPFAVVGPSLYYVAEGEGVGGTSGATTFPRWLVCVDWAGGKNPLEPRAPAARPAPSDGGCRPGLHRRRGGDKGRQWSSAGGGVPRAGTGGARPV